MTLGMLMLVEHLPVDKGEVNSPATKPCPGLPGSSHSLCSCRLDMQTARTAKGRNCNKLQQT